MGVIQRQSLKSSIISYLGVGIGIISAMFIYPHAVEIVGLFRAMYDASVLIGILVLAGSTSSAVRFFPKYQDTKTGHGGLLTWLLMVAGLGFLVFLLAFPFLYTTISKFIFHEKNRLYSDFVIYLMPLTFFVALANLLTRYISNFNRIAIPTAFDQLTIKIALPLLVLLYLSGWLTAESFMIGVIVSFAFSAFGMLYYLKFLGELKFTRPVILEDRAGIVEYSKYSWFGLLAGIGSQVAFRIDSLMVTRMINLQATGVYAISWALSEIINKPMRSVGTIAGPLLAQKIEAGKMDEVETIYKKSSLNMTIIGLGLFLLIWSVLPFVFGIMSNSDVMKQGSYVVFFLGLAQVWDMMTGVNSEIMSYSKHYRFVLYLTLFLSLITILFNIIFIPLYGLAGSALATCLSMFIYNMVKLIFIKVKFGFQPFSSRLIPVIGFGVGAWMITTALPDTGKDVMDLFYKSAVFTLLYGVAIWKFNISADINQWIELILSRIKLTFTSKQPS